MGAPRKKTIIDSEEEEEVSAEVEESSDEAPAPRSKRSITASNKQASLDKENFEAKLKKLEALQKEVNKMKKKSKEASKSKSKDYVPDDDDVESEDEMFEKTGFSSSIKPLATVAVTNRADDIRTPLKRIGAAAAQKPVLPPRISSNAFKTLPPPAPTSSDCEDVDGSGPSGPGSSSPTVAAQKRQRSGSASDGSEELLVDPASKKTKTAEPVPASKTTVATPAFRSGADVNPKKLKASDFEEVVRALILRAASEYESLVSTSDALPDTAKRFKWARQSWKNACLAAEEPYKITDGISSILQKRGSRIRGHALNQIRPLMVNVFGFKRGTDAKTVAWNRDLYTKLKTKAAFHYKNPETLSGYAQGKIISEILHAVWFEDTNSQGVTFKNLFDPIPLETLALIFTILDFCLDEWSDGTRVKAKLWGKDIKDRHEIFHKDLAEWAALNVEVVTAIRRKLYTRSCRNAGVVTQNANKPTLSAEAKERAREELAGRTGETDSEMED
ncbi:hypothetical protein BDZ97DRAFT_1760386 [Flammula alnicola]|nr:hypothetical protein BDZ97DRAFT_1760386 [Flammula alnicola]